MKANPDSVFSLAGRTANKINSLNIEQAVIDSIIEDSNHSYWVGIEAVLKSLSTEERWKKGFKDLYMKFLNLDISPEFENFKWPKARGESYWFIFRPRGLTLETAIEKLCRPQFKTEIYINPSFCTLERQPDQAHLVLCRDGVEPDVMWRDKTEENMNGIKTPFLDICDRAILEAIHFFVEGSHLDHGKPTRCLRSCYRDNYIADAYWHEDSHSFMIGSNPLDHHSKESGWREAIVLPCKNHAKIN